MSELDGLRRDRDAEAKRFSWPRALLHAGLVLIAIFVVGIVLGAMGSRDVDPRAFGQMLGKLAVYGAIAAFGLSYVLQTRSWRGLVGGVALVAVLGGAAAIGMRSRQAVSLTAADRRPLELTAEGERRLRHPTLGFSFQVPADFEPLPPAVATKLSSAPAVASSGWGNTSTGRLVIVTVMPLRAERELRGFLEGVRDGETQLVQQTLGARITLVGADEFVWNDARREAHRHVSFGAGHMRTDAFVNDYAGRSLAVVLVSISRDDDSLADLAASFRAR